MGIEDRRKRHREDFKVRILEAAKKLFIKNGYESTSIRKIAAEIEFSPTTIYLYYKDKTDIAYALHQEGFNLLRERFRILPEEQPFEHLKNLGKAYIQFAMEHPDFYELMFIMKEPMQFLKAHHPEDEWPEGSRVFDALMQTVVACQQDGHFARIAAPHMAMLAWATVHGLCSLHITTHFKHVSEKFLSEIEPLDTHVLLGRIFDSYMLMLESVQ